MWGARPPTTVYVRLVPLKEHSCQSVENHWIKERKMQMMPTKEEEIKKTLSKNITASTGWWCSVKFLFQLKETPNSDWNTDLEWVFWIRLRVCPSAEYYGIPPTCSDLFVDLTVYLSASHQTRWIPSLFRREEESRDLASFLQVFSQWRLWYHQIKWSIAPPNDLLSYHGCSLFSWVPAKISLTLYIFI